jgi:preprotein translocase subunit SecG
MGFIIGLLTFFMVLDCVFLILLVLIQLPKKEAGAGLAFGAGATDALFGAGSGTALTKITKYSAVIFFALAVILSLMQSSYNSRRSTQFQENLGKSPRQVTGALPPSPAAAPAPAMPATTITSPSPSSTPAAGATNIPLLAIPADTNGAK